MSQEVLFSLALDHLVPERMNYSSISVSTIVFVVNAHLLSLESTFMIFYVGTIQAVLTMSHQDLRLNRQGIVTVVNV